MIKHKKICIKHVKKQKFFAINRLIEINSNFNKQICNKINFFFNF